MFKRPTPPLVFPTADLDGRDRPHPTRHPGAMNCSPAVHAQRP